MKPKKSSVPPMDLDEAKKLVMGMFDDEGSYSRDKIIALIQSLALLERETAQTWARELTTSIQIADAATAEEEAAYLYDSESLDPEAIRKIKPTAENKRIFRAFWQERGDAETTLPLAKGWYWTVPGVQMGDQVTFVPAEAGTMEKDDLVVVHGTEGGFLIRPYKTYVLSVQLGKERYKGYCPGTVLGKVIRVSRAIAKKGGANG